MIATYPTPIINQFNEINKGKYLGTKHFELERKTNSKEIISPKIRLAVNRSFAKSLPTYWLSFRPLNKWVSITGLFKTSIPYYFKGDADNKKHLIIARIDEIKNTFVLFYFKDYYTKDAATIQCIIDNLKSIYNKG
jgi:hypothetical protein